MKAEVLEPTSFSKALKAQYTFSDMKIRENLLMLTTDASTYVDLATYLKECGFSRCLTVAVIDWLDQGEFEVYYVIHQLASNLYVKVATRIPRNKPEIKSLSTIWESAAMHEREMWELFGVNFVGNTMLKPLFLEGWTGKPPLRKDFDWRNYVGKEYFELGEK